MFHCEMLGGQGMNSGEFGQFSCGLDSELVLHAIGAG